MYRALKTFRDKDTRVLYQPGDEYPRPGTEADAARLEALSTAKNLRGMPLIERVEEDTPEDEKPRRGRRKAAENEE